MKNEKKVLIIEDEPSLLRALKDKLERNGLSVFYAVNGDEGLRMVKKEKPNLVLLDLILPKMTGETVLKRMKEDKNLQNIPVVVLSAKADEATVVNCLNNLGASDYMVKSDFTLEQVLDKINKYVN
ncbi:MAG: response regulator [Bacteriovorax sp.]|nr:response regulator [Bacteriovorax sp.]